MAEETTRLKVAPVSEAMVLLDRIEQLTESLPAARELINAREAADFCEYPTPSSAGWQLTYHGTE